MVRRRATKAAAAFAADARGTSKIALENGGSVLKSSSSSSSSTSSSSSSVGCSQQLEDQYFASPKRKDCKVEDDVVFYALLNMDEEQGASLAIAAAGVFTEATDHKHANMKSKSSAAGKTRGERANIADRTIGVPLATRSQTRTIESFFRAKTAANNAKLQQDVAEDEQLQTMHNGVGCAAVAVADTAVESYSPLDALPPTDDVQSPLAEVIFNINEDTNDTNINVEADEAALGADFSTHRSPMRDSHSSRSSTSTSGSNTDNIFLQEPVLTLNFDKTLNQASSIKINTSLEVEPIFSLPHPHMLTAAVLNGRFNQIVSLNGGSLVYKRDSLSFDSQNNAIATLKDEDDELLVPDNDNSSCDSGVAFTTSLNSDLLLAQADSASGVGCLGGSTRRRKPATPHRIVCPSPIKAAPRVISPAHAAHGGGHSPTVHKSKELLSPRKSPRQMAITNSKTRRRLNHQKEFNTTLNSDRERTKFLNGCKKLNGVDIKAEQEDLNFENLEVADLYKAIECKKEVAVAEIMHERSKTKVHTVKMQQKSSKLQSGGLPLATTNGNRELSEFFPVRRSVRKTKTAVKEEMMRNLEQAVLEERADGLKIAYFEGKGRGIIADRHFERGEFVVEYVGDLISMTEATEREKRYALDENAGCYMYYFKHKNQQYCIDATVDTGKLGRLVNHSRNGNLVTKVVVVKQRPHLILIAKDNLEPGEELTYDYGDRSKESLLHHPWLAF